PGDKHRRPPARQLRGTVCYACGYVKVPSWRVLFGVSAVAVTAAAGTFWSRQRADGVVEFINKAPAGKAWKVLFKTGPGKAGALRGSTDIVPPRDTAPARFSRYDRDIRDGQAFYGIP